MQMKQERRSEAEAGAEDGPSEGGEQGWRLGVIDLGVEGEERATVEAEKGKTEEEEDAFEIALAAVAEDDNHPEKHQEGAGGEADEADVEKGGHL